MDFYAPLQRGFAALREGEGRHHANALVPRGSEPIRVYRRNILGPHWAIPSIALAHY